MALLGKILTVTISLVTGLAVTREVYGILPPWAGEGWPLVILDGSSLLLTFLLVAGLVYYLIDDLGGWLLQRIKRPPRD